MIHWKKKGLIFKFKSTFSNYSQYPVPLKFKNFIRIFFSTRDKLGRSLPLYVDVSNNLKKVLFINRKPILTLGKPGSFDQTGVMPSEIIKIGKLFYLFYVGWNSKVNTAPYLLNIGLAISKDGKVFRKYSKVPIFYNYKNLDKKNKINFCGSSTVIKYKNYFYMFYMSGKGWHNVNGRENPLYNIKIKKSKDCVNWVNIKKTAIELKNNEGGLTPGSVIKINKSFFMYYSYRGKDKFRNNEKNTYRIGVAKSENLINWIRQDNLMNLNITKNSWDANMLAYPKIIKLNKNYVMFYNGNGFGQSGIGIAKSENTRK
jgi:predicted GH43/DUF377 family glycosyl hydrolase